MCSWGLCRLSSAIDTTRGLGTLEKEDPGGAAAFSNLYDQANFPFNVPDALWTAACCIVKDNNGDIVKNKVINIAFYMPNIPSKIAKCERSSVKTLFWNLGLINGPVARLDDVNLFPAVPECSDPGPKYHRPLFLSTGSSLGRACLQDFSPQLDKFTCVVSAMSRP